VTTELPGKQNQVVECLYKLKHKGKSKMHDVKDHKGQTCKPNSESVEANMWAKQNSKSKLRGLDYKAHTNFQASQGLKVKSVMPHDQWRRQDRKYLTTDHQTMHIGRWRWHRIGPQDRKYLILPCALEVACLSGRALKLPLDMLCRQVRDGCKSRSLWIGQNHQPHCITG